jgi:lipoyl(octanoyl) transferase
MKNLIVRDLGIIDYEEAWILQKEIFSRLIEAKLTGEDEEMQILFAEHPHVYTMGAHGDLNNILFSDDFLKRINAQYYKVERGGDVTYHGYGQLVGYPVVDLERLKLGIKQYIWSIEEAVIKTIGEYGIKGQRLNGATGVWIVKNGQRPAKICAIGIKSSRFVCMHGFALNVTTDLEYFTYINPCGFTDREVTSIEKETGLRPGLKEVQEQFLKYFLK